MNIFWEFSDKKGRIFFCFTKRNIYWIVVHFNLH